VFREEEGRREIEGKAERYRSIERNTEK